MYWTFFGRILFQFHKGTIRTSIETILPRSSTTFQFHKGTIRTTNDPTALEHLIYFNSIKVRLERLNHLKLANLDGFQFHKGTIRTWRLVTDDVAIPVFQFHKGTIRTNDLSFNEMQIRHFNSIKVRLEPCVQAYPDIRFRISIP